MFSKINFWWLLTGGLLVLWLYSWYQAYQRYQVGQRLAAQAQAYQQAPADPTMSILVLGDSTAVGTGADSPNDSMAGRLGKNFPPATITNLGKNGALVSDAIAQIQTVKNQKFDLILIHVTGNNVVYHAEREAMPHQLQALLTTAKSMSHAVVMTSHGDIGRAPFWPWGLGWYFTHQARQARQIVQAVTQQTDVIFVDFFRPAALDPFAQDPLKYHAADGFHPSSAGYGVWYGQIKVVLQQPKVLK